MLCLKLSFKKCSFGNIIVIWSLLIELVEEFSSISGFSFCPLTVLTGPSTTLHKNPQHCCGVPSEEKTSSLNLSSYSFLNTHLPSWYSSKPFYCVGNNQLGHVSWPDHWNEKNKCRVLVFADFSAVRTPSTVRFRVPMCQHGAKRWEDGTQ